MLRACGLLLWVLLARLPAILAQEADEDLTAKIRSLAKEMGSDEEPPQDTNPECPDWAAHGMCESSPDYMLKTCPLSCGASSTSLPPAEPPIEEVGSADTCSAEDREAGLCGNPLPEEASLPPPTEPEIPETPGQSAEELETARQLEEAAEAQRQEEEARKKVEEEQEAAELKEAAEEASRRAAEAAAAAEAKAAAEAEAAAAAEAEKAAADAKAAAEAQAAAEAKAAAEADATQEADALEEAMLKEEEERLAQEAMQEEKAMYEDEEEENAMKEEVAQAAATRVPPVNNDAESGALRAQLKQAEMEVDSFRDKVQALTRQKEDMQSLEDAANRKAQMAEAEKARIARELEETKESLQDAERLRQQDVAAAKQEAKQEVDAVKAEFEQQQKADAGIKDGVLAVYSVFSVCGAWAHKVVLGASQSAAQQFSSLEPPLNIIAGFFSVFVLFMVSVRGFGKRSVPMPMPVMAAAPMRPAPAASSASVDISAALAPLQQQISELWRHQSEESLKASRNLMKLEAQLKSFQNECNNVEEEMLLSTKEILAWLSNGETSERPPAQASPAPVNGLQVASTNGITAASIAPPAPVPSLVEEPRQPAIFSTSEVQPKPETSAPSMAGGDALAPVPSAMAEAPVVPASPPIVPLSPAFAATGDAIPPPLEAPAVPSSDFLQPKVNDSVVPPAEAPPTSFPPAAQVEDAVTTSAPPVEAPIVPDTVAPTPTFPPANSTFPFPTSSPTAPTPAPVEEPAPPAPSSNLGQPSASEPVLSDSAPPVATPPPFESNAPPTNGGPPAMDGPPTAPAAVNGPPPVNGPPSFSGPPSMGGPPSGGAMRPQQQEIKASSNPFGGARPQQQEIKASSNPFGGGRPQQQPIQAASNAFGVRPQQKAIAATQSPFGMK